MLFLDPFKKIYTNRKLIYDLSRREMESRYKGSMLGKLWIIFNHLTLISIYTFVFGFVFQTKMNTSLGEIGLDFALWLYCGMLPWFFLNESLTISVKDIVGKVNYVKKIVFPLEVLPITTVIVAFINMLFGLLILLVCLLAFGHGFHWTNLLYFLIIPPLILTGVGFALVVSTLGVYFRDLAQMVGLLTMLWMYATPILYNAEMVPEKFNFMFKFNLLYKIVEYCRDSLFWSKIPDLIFLIWFYILAILIYFIGYKIFNKFKTGFADVL